MTNLLTEAIAEITKLPEDEQNTIASWILAELASEKRWEAAFEASSDILQRLADEALAEYRAGKTEELDPDKL